MSSSGAEYASEPHAVFIMSPGAISVLIPKSDTFRICAWLLAYGKRLERHV